MADQYFIMNCCYFYDDRSRFYYKWARFSWWYVEILLWAIEIFMMTGQEFILNGQDFRDHRLRWLWMVETFMMTVWDFHYHRSRFSWWQAKIFIMACQDFFSHNCDQGCLFSTLFSAVNFSLIPCPFFMLSLRLLFWKCVAYFLGCSLINESSVTICWYVLIS